MFFFFIVLIVMINSFRNKIIRRFLNYERNKKLGKEREKREREKLKRKKMLGFINTEGDCEKFD